MNKLEPTQEKKGLDAFLFQHKRWKNHYNFVLCWHGEMSPFYAELSYPTAGYSFMFKDIENPVSSAQTHCLMVWTAGSTCVFQCDSHTYFITWDTRSQTHRTAFRFKLQQSALHLLLIPGNTHITALLHLCMTERWTISSSSLCLVAKIQCW